MWIIHNTVTGHKAFYLSRQQFNEDLANRPQSQGWWYVPQLDGILMMGLDDDDNELDGRHRIG